MKTANETKGNRLDTIEENLTNAERLEKDVLFGIDSTMAPPNLTKVFLNFDLANAKFNAQKAFLSSRGRFRAVNSSTYLIIFNNKQSVIEIFCEMFAALD